MSDNLKTLETQVKLIQEQNKALVDFSLAANLDKLVFKDTEGNLDLGSGILEADKAIAGAFSVKVIKGKEDNRTIGTATICPSGKVLKTDLDKDEKDWTCETAKDGDTTSDSRKVFVKTKAVKDNSKVFVTPAGETPVNWIISNIDDGSGFDIVIGSPTDELVRFNWWIVDEK